jgi:REP element-mobilizing transposase RayT
MSEHIVKRHNKTLLLYHLVVPVKYRNAVFSDSVEATLKEVCIEIGQRYEIHYLEIGTDENHVHFLIQSVPAMTVSKMVGITKSITAREIFKRHKEVRRVLWGGHFWTSGFYMNTVGRYGNEKVIQAYVEGQGKKYKRVHRDQLTLFDGL